MRFVVVTSGKWVTTGKGWGIWGLLGQWLWWSSRESLHDGVGLGMIFWHDEWLFLQGSFASCILQEFIDRASVFKWSEKKVLLFIALRNDGESHYQLYHVHCRVSAVKGDGDGGGEEKEGREVGRWGKWWDEGDRRGKEGEGTGEGGAVVVYVAWSLDRLLCCCN